MFLFNSIQCVELVTRNTAQISNERLTFPVDFRSLIAFLFFPTIYWQAICNVFILTSRILILFRLSEFSLTHYPRVVSCKTY